MSQKILDRIKSKFADAVIEAGMDRGDAAAVVKREAWFDVVKFLKEDPECRMDHFIDLTCVDWPEKPERFEVVLHLRSMALNHRIRLKTRAGMDSPVVPSLTQLYKGADWFEREAYDMYGVKFQGHPDLRRILLWEAFEGHPLRKDYPKDRRQCPIPFREECPKQPPPFRERS
jgi:NADH-quinone oxidoreductase subunit C